MDAFQFLLLVMAGACAGVSILNLLNLLWDMFWSRVSKTDPLTLYFLECRDDVGIWRTSFSGAFIVYEKSVDLTHQFYENVGKHWYPDCLTEEWRILDIALDMDIDPVFALHCARKKGF